MNICVVGWYFYQELYVVLEKVHKVYPVFIVAHKYDLILDKSDLPYYVRENRGLEFGAYNWFLQNIWKGDSVLFQHDDIRVKGIETYHRIDDLSDDQVYIFDSEYEKKRNRGVHGRVFKCSAKMLTQIKGNDGIWNDHTNPGNVFNLHPDPDKGEGLDFNAGICRFRDDMLKYRENGFETGKSVIIPSFQNGERGKFREEVL